MKKFHAFMAVCTLMATGAVSATTVYSNGTPNFSSAVFSLESDAQFENGGTTMFNDFDLQTGQNTFDGLQWWGTRAGGDTHSSEFDDFTVFIYGDDGGVPGTSLLHEINLSVVNRSDHLGGGQYRFTANFSEITLAANTTYWIGIQNDSGTATDSRWYWTTHVFGLGNTRYRNGNSDTNFAIAAELAFELTYDGSSAPIPEPATLSLLGMGLAGLAVRARRKRA